MQKEKKSPVAETEDTQSKNTESQNAGRGTPIDTESVAVNKEKEIEIDVCCEIPKETDTACDKLNNREQSFLGYGRAQTNFHPKSQSAVEQRKLH